MPNATVRANARTMPKPPPQPAPSTLNEATDALNGLVSELKGMASAEHAFERAYYGWLKARAAANNPDCDEDLTGEEIEAERNLMLTPARHPWQVWEKLEVFELELSEEMRDGPRLDRFLMLAFGAIKTDMIRLGICHGCISDREGAVQ